MKTGFHPRLKTLKMPSMFLYIALGVVGFTMVHKTIADLNPLPYESELDRSVLAMTTSQDGELIVAGDFSRLLKIDQKGELDSQFGGRDEQGFNRPVTEILSLPNGGYLVGGQFTAYNQIIAGYMTKLDRQGRVDNDFAVNAGTGFDGIVKSIHLLNNGNYLVGGEFRQYNGYDAPYLAEIGHDGRMIRHFNVDGPVNKIARMNDQLVLIGGSFQNVGDSAADAFAMLQVGE